jgi:hypothetical protein
MKNIDLNIKRMLSLLESKMGNVKPLINEQFVPASFLPKQDWILKKEPEEWLKWILDKGCISRRPGGAESKISEITTTTTDKLQGINSNEPLIKVTKFNQINKRGFDIPTNLYILGKKSREGKEGYFKLFYQIEGDKSNQYLEGQLDCSVQYKDETTSIASGVRDMNIEEPVNQALFSICYTRQLDPNYAPQSETETTIKKICDDNPGVCGTNSLLKKYAEGKQGIIAIFEMSPDQKRKSACRTNEDIVNTRQSLWNLKRQNKKTLKSVRDKQSCKAMLETAKGCKNKEPGVCNQLINNNQDLRGLAYPAAKMEMVKFIKFCRDENMYNKNQLADVNDLRIDGVNAGIQLEQTIGKNIRESLKELNLINKIG